ncbi:MAG: CoA transferase [Lysobacterales bacterium]|jgi:crotonobetainyl-CoA:carnitine CoA-transferase CaiB-like acyl-CoA transferase|nr:MAG: CoA transferase [Xanthomonadales bacterium]
MKLEGLRVLDLSLFLPGPMASLMLADHGAEVIKLEPPGEGEPTRHIGLRQGGRSVWFRNTHRGKKSISINLKDRRGRDAVLRIAEGCDVFIEAFRPGVMKRLGLDYEAIAARNPRIVYCSIAAFGQDGPLAERPAHDLAVQALSGLLACNIDREGRPINAHLPAADMAASFVALAGILMALWRREKTGRGDYLDVAMLDSLMAWTVNVTGPVFAEHRAPYPPHERSFGGNAFYRIYRCRDGRYLALGGSEQKFVLNLLKALGREDLAPLHAQGPGPHQAPLVAFLKETFASRTLAEWEAFLADIDVCWAPVLDLREAFEQPQARARSLLLHDREGIPHIAPPIRFREEPAQPDFALPKIGEHNREILTRAGFSEAEIAALESEGVLFTEAPHRKA